MKMNSNKMQLIVQLKPIEQLKSLPTFSHDYDNYLLFKDDSIITSDMINKYNVELTWVKKLKSFVDNDNNTYSIDWLTNITVSDDKLKLGLEINDCDLTVRILEMDESLFKISVYKSYECKNSPTYKFVIFNYGDDNTSIHNRDLFLGINNTATHTFKSPKQLTKFIRRLILCK